MNPLLVMTASGMEYQLLWQCLSHPKVLHHRRDHGFASVTSKIEDREVLLVMSGMGSKAIQHAILTMTQTYTLSGIYHTGLCGSLSESYSVGSVSSPSRIYGEDHSFVECVGNAGHIWVSVDPPALSRERKLALASKFRATHVDMESWALVKLCQSKQIPFTILKYVMDDLNTEDYNFVALKRSSEIAQEQLRDEFLGKTQRLLGQWF